MDFQFRAHIAKHARELDTFIYFNTESIIAHSSKTMSVNTQNHHEDVLV